MQKIEWKFRDVKSKYDEKKVSNAKDIYNMFKTYFKGKTQEEFICVWLNSSNKIQGFEILYKGTLNSTVVSSREVFRSAIVSSCNAIILIHNHPSGNIIASQEDIKLTKNLIEVAKIIGIQIFDHVIFGKGYTSMIEKRLI